MKKNVIALLMAVVMASGSIGTVPAFATETPAEQTVETEEEKAEGTEEVTEETDDASEGETVEDISEVETVEDVSEGETVEETSEGETVEAPAEEPEQNLDESAVEAETSEETEAAEDTEEKEAETAVNEAKDEETGVTEEAEGDDSADSADTFAETTEDEESVIEEYLTEEEGKEAALAGNVVASGTCGENLTWTLADGLLTISGTGEMTSSPWKDDYQEDIIRVEMEEGVTSVVYDAFANCSKITEIQLPDTVSIIEGGAFSYCTSLEKINIPDSIKENDDIYLSWFEGCEKLKTAGPIGGGYNIEFGWTERIPSNAFCDSDYLESVIVPEGITSVGQRAFFGCKNLEYISFPNSLTQIGNEGYSGGIFNYQCCKLVTVGPKGTGCNIELGNMDSIPDYMFEACTGLSSIVFPETITRIGRESFRSCTSLKEIVIPENIEEVRNWAFYGCSSLEHVVIPASVQSIDEAFEDCNRLLTAGPIGGGYNIEFGWTNKIPAGALEDCRSLESVIIPDGVSSIGSCAFYGCYNLEYILIPGSVTEVGESYYTAGLFGDGCEKLLTAGYIGTGCNIEFGWTERIPEDAFKSTKSLRNITIPNTISQIGEGAFFRCVNLESISLPDSVQAIEGEAFLQCDSLKKVIIPDTDITFGINVFASCPKLKTAGPTGGGYDIEFGWKESIPDQAFYGCDNLLSMIIPDGINDIGKEAFRECYHLEYLRIPESVNTIHGYNSSIYTGCYELETAGPIGGGYNIEFGWTESTPMYAFFGCDGLKSVFLPDGMTEVGYEAFYDCQDLEYVRIPQSLTSWHESSQYSGTFHDCSKLITAGPIGGGYNIEFGWKESLPDYVFGGCQYLRRVDIPFGITSIGSHAFSYCTSLTGITIPNSVTEIGGFAFWKCSGLENITIPNSVVDLGGGVFGECSNLKSVRLSNRLTEIKYACFGNCGNLISVEIPLSIVNVGSCAFEDCINLQDVYYKGTARQWDQIQIKEDNDPLINASIHYLATESGDSSGVYTFDSWKEEENSVYLDGWPYEVSEYADMSFKDHTEELVGNKVFVEFLEHQVYRISELEEHVGIIGDYSVSENEWGPYVSQLSIDNYKYATAADYVIGVYEIDKYVNGSYVFYYTSDDRVVYVSPLQYCVGRLDSNVIENNTLTINNKSFGLWKYMDVPDENELAEWEGKRIGYYTEETNEQEENTQTVFLITGLAEGASKIVLFSSNPEFEIQVGESMELVASLRTNGFPDLNWSQPSFVISDDSVISISDFTQLSLGGYDFDVYGLAEGKSTLTISDSETGAHVSVTVSVVPNTSTAKNYSYKMDSVPAFYPDYVDDMDKLTNFYDFNGLYVNNYNTETAADGATRATFDVYNTQYMIGAVDVFDADGNWINSVPIKKYTDITSIYDTGETFLALCNNLVNGKLLSYTSSYYSEKTPVDIIVPAGGYFTISNNYAVSPGVYFYNGIDYLTYCIETICDVVVTSDKNKDKDYQYSTSLLSEFFQKMEKDKLNPGSGFSNSMSSSDVMELIVSKMNSFNTKAIGRTTTRNLGDAMGVSLDDFKDLLDVIGLDWKGAAKNTFGLGESVFEKVSGPAGFALKGMFTINKVTSRVLQTNSIYHSLNRSYISIHSSAISNSKTVSGVTVSYGDGAVDDDMVFQVFRLAAPEETYSVEDQDVHPEEYALYNIGFVKNEQNVQPNGMVTVKIPVPAGMTGKGCTVYRQEEDGTWTRINAAVDGKYLVFETNHFCLFMIKNDYTGMCTDNINWEFSDEGQLVIAGNGEIPNYSENNAPWNSYSDQIRKITIGENITKIGEHSFSGLTNVTSVELPYSLKEIRKSAFSECNSLTEVLYSGEMKDWQKINILDGNASVLYATIHYLTSGTSSNEPISCGESKTINITAGNEYTLKFTPTESNTYYFCSESDADTYGIVYDNNHNILKNDDDSGQNSNFRIEYYFEAGNTYILAAKFYNADATGDISVKVEKSASIIGIESISVEGELLKNHSGTMDTELLDDKTEAKWFRYDIQELNIVYTLITDENSGDNVFSGNSTDIYNKFKQQIVLSDNQSFDNQWTVGKHVVTASINGYSYDFEVEVVDYNVSVDDEIVLGEVKSLDVAQEQEYLLEFTPSEDGNYVFYAKSDYDTYGTIYDCFMNALAQNDDGNGLNFSVSCYMRAGEKYILAAKFYSETQAGTLDVVIEKKKDPVDISTALITDITDQVYTGYDITPVPEVEIDERILESGRDYTVSFLNNNNAGTATVMINGIGDYTGHVEKTFTILKANQSISVSDLTVVEGKNVKISVSGIEENARLTYESSNTSVVTVGDDGTVTAAVGSAGKSAVVTIKAAETANYKADSTVLTVRVQKEDSPAVIDISADMRVKVSGGLQYTGKEQKPIITVTCHGKTLIAETDYDINYKESTHVNAGTYTATIRAKGAYTGTKDVSFKIAKANQTLNCKTRALTNGTADIFTVTGGHGTLTFTVVNKAIATPKASGSKVIVTSKRVGATKMTVTATGDKNYNKAKISCDIKVLPSATKSLKAENLAKGIKVSWAAVPGATGYDIYRNGTKLTSLTGGATVSYADKKATANGKAYTYKVVAKAATGISPLSKSVMTYCVTRPKISSVKNTESEKATAKWKKNAKATGYELQYSLKKNFKSGVKKATIKKKATVSRVLKSLKKKKTYYVRIRTYKTVGGKKYYSAWSAAKKVKIKK